MKTSKQMILTVLASLLPLTTIACGGSSGEVDPVTGQPAPSASSSSSSQDDAGAPGTNNNNSNNNGSSTSDAGTTANDGGGGGATTIPVSPNCNVAVTSPDLCVDDVHGAAGSIIDLPIEFLSTAACPDALEASGHLQMSQYFMLANPEEQIDCMTRELYAAPPADEIEVMWDAFGANSIGACPNKIKSGHLDTVKIEILPGTPSGDYDVTWVNGFIATGAAVGCDMVNPAINGHIHVD